jgi:two-component system, response regulator
VLRAGHGVQFLKHSITTRHGLAPPWALQSRTRLTPRHASGGNQKSGCQLSNKTILLIEDNPSDIALTRRALERAHIANLLVTAEDGQEALDFLFCTGPHAGREISQQPVLTLLDLKLPKISGLDVLRRIRSDPRTRRMPVVILTSSDEALDISSGYDLGINSYIRKPVDFEQFQRVVEQLGLYWLVLNEPPPASSEELKP